MAEEKHHESKAKLRSELAATFILSIAVVASAYCAYQSTRWSGLESLELGKAATLRVESAKALNLGTQQMTYDAILFSQMGLAYHQGDMDTFNLLREQLARPEFGGYIDKWVTQNPRGDSGSPQTPFEVEGFNNAEIERSKKLQKEAEEAFVDAQRAIRTGDDYILATVFFAGVLFFGGVSTKIESIRLRWTMLVFAGAWLVGGFFRALTLPFH